MTWFRKERDIHWFEGFGGEPWLQQNVLEFLDKRLP